MDSFRLHRFIQVHIFLIFVVFHFHTILIQAGGVALNLTVANHLYLSEYTNSIGILFFACLVQFSHLVLTTRSRPLL